MKIKDKLLGALGKQLVVFSIAFLAINHSYAQTCENLAMVTETICDMTIIGDDGMGNPNGVLDLYKVIEGFYTLTNFKKPGDVWVDVGMKNAVTALDTLTGTLNLWQLRESSIELDDYVFRLKNDTENCPSRVAVRIVLGPHASTGIGTPAAPYFACDREDECLDTPLVDIDLFTALATTRTIPAAHINGLWTLTDAPSGVLTSLKGSLFYTSVPYTPGDDIADSETFSFRYEVPGIGGCSSDVTELTISVLRQPFPGFPGKISICEKDIETDWDIDIDLRDDRFLIREDVEGFWQVDSLQITNQFDSEINIAEAFRYYQDSINTNPRFGCHTFEYKYSVRSRAAACEDSTATISFTIFESLRDIVQRDSVRIVCPVTEPRDQIDLFDEITFQEGFVYTQDISWLFIKGPAGEDDLNLELNIENAEPGQQFRGTVDIDNAIPGVYEFEYFVDTASPCVPSIEPIFNICDPVPINSSPCRSVSTTVIVEILDYDFAGNDTSGISLCIADAEVDLRSLLTNNGRPIEEGVWTDEDNTIIPNTFVFPPDISTSTAYRLTHTTTNASGCSDTAILEFTLYIEPNPGENVVHQVCSNNRTVTLFDELGGDPDPTGEWFGPFGYTSEGDHMGIFTEGDETLQILAPGEYVYTVPGNPGCTRPAQSTVTIVINEPTELGENINESFCKIDGRVNLFTLLNQNTVLTGTFVDSDSTGALTSEGVVEFQNLENEIYSFEYVINNELPCDKSSLTINIQIIDLPEPNVGDQEFCILDAKRLDDIDVDVFGYNWYATLESDTPIMDNPLLLDNQVYYIATVDVDGCESDRVTVAISILNTGEKSLEGEICTLDFQDGVSPNGDNQNDTFDLFVESGYNIPEAFPDFELKIYNRYGSLVYNGKRDTEEFRGESNTSVRLGDDLPSGTYFYVFEPNFKSNLPIQGSFYLSR